MVCQRGGFIIQRHNELRDLKAGMLRIVCNDVEVEPVLQEVTGETLNHGANKASDASLDIHSRGFWERQRSAFLDVRVYHPNADSYRDLTPKQSFKKHENEKKRHPGGGVLPYMGYIGMCRCEGYGFQAVYSRIGYINQSVWV